jgi:hypothetical protein
MPHRPSVVGVFWNLWRFNAHSEGNFDVVVLLRRRSKGGMNNFVTKDACVIKFCKIVRQCICTLYLCMGGKTMTI